jgi:nucleotidyltransferase substrate binding protein (TIGR01987 family)
MQDIRWQQRFSNFRRALAKLEKAVELVAERQLSELEMQGLIQSFEYTYELSWNVLKDYLQYQGNQELTGARDTFTEAFRVRLISNGKEWLRMLHSRTQTSHTYDEQTAILVAEAVVTIYYDLFKELETSYGCKNKPKSTFISLKIMNKYGLSSETFEQIQATFRQFPQVQKAILYGSRAKGNFHNGSDIDIVLQGNDLNLQVLADIGLSLDDLFLPYKIDLSILQHINNPDLLSHIERVGVVINE